jgi:pimeloyl-ACP methyl ester carboxylesterase
MRSRRLPALGAGLAALSVLTACSSDSTPPEASGSRAVVMMSGVLSTTPYTTPDSSCGTGFAAGNTNTFLRDYLIAEGFDVYTVPARPGGGVVEETEDPYDGPFGDCPEQLPASMTVDTTAVLTDGAERIRAFVQHLHDEFGVTEIDVIGHSLGGPLSRTGIGAIQSAGTPVTVRSLTTIGSPWEPPMLARPTDPNDRFSACDGLEICVAFVSAIFEAEPTITPLTDMLSIGYTDWANSLSGTLDDIPVTLIGGSYFTKDGGNPDKWPNDGAIQVTASLATNVSDEMLPQRTCHEFANTHSLSVSLGIGAAEETALTWNPEVGAVIVDALRATTPPPNREGCPAAP